MKELQSVKTFAENSKELYTAFKDYFDHTQSERGVQGKQFSAKSLDDKETVINKLFAEEVARRSNVSVDAYNGDYAHYAQNPLVRTFADAIADQMIDMILPEILNGSVGLIADIRYVDWGDSASFELENNALFNVSKAGYRQRNGVFQKLENQTVTLAPENHDVSVITNLFNVLTNRDSIAKYIIKASRSIEAEMLNEAYSAFTAGVEGVKVGNLVVENYSETSAIELAQKVTAWNGGRKAVFAGTPIALKALLPKDGNYRYFLSDDYVKLGHVPTFNNYDVVVMEQVADYASADYGMKLNDEQIYVLSPSSDKIVKIVVGGTMSNTSGGYDNANLAQTGHISKAWATAVITNSIAGQIGTTI